MQVFFCFISDQPAVKCEPKYIVFFEKKLLMHLSN